MNELLAGRLMEAWADQSAPRRVTRMKGAIVFSGRQQSGKDSMGRYLLDVVQPNYLGGTGKIFKYADSLKRYVSELFFIDPVLYETEAGKQTLTKVRWCDLPHRPTSRGTLTVRELLQYFGTEIVRRMNPDAWVNACWADIEKSNVDLAVITDCRFPNEVLAAKARGAKVIRLRRNGDQPATHASELALDEANFDWSLFDAIIEDGSLEHTQARVFWNLYRWQWFALPDNFSSVLV